MKNPIVIHVQEFVVAMQMNEDMYLEKNTGEIIASFDESFSAEILQDKNKYLLIEKISSCESFQIMQNFTLTVTNESIRAILCGILKKRSPFRNFKDILYNYPDIQKTWHSFEQKEKAKIAKIFLQENDILFTFIA